MKALTIGRGFYFFLIFFLSFGMLLTFFQNLVYAQHGPQIYSQPAFIYWFCFSAMIDIALMAITIKYYHSKNYRLTFLLNTIYLATTLLLYFTILRILIFNKPDSLNQPALFAYLGIQLLYGASLIFSNTRKQSWLKMAGILIVIFDLIVLIALIWSLYDESMYVKSLYDKSSTAISWAGSLITISFIFNFWNDLKSEQATTSSVNLPALLLTAITLFTLAFISGKKLLNESTLLGYPHIISEKARGMAALFEAGNYVDMNGDTLRYRLMKPLDYDPKKKYPVVVLLHHGGAHGDDNILQIEGSNAPFFSNYVNKRKYPAFLFVPQCPREMSWGTPAITLLTFQALHNLEKEFSIDVKRRYVMGLSGGGYGSWHFITTHPKMFAAAIPICGGGDPELAKAVTDVAIWAFHGKKDELAPVSQSRVMISAIKAAGGNPKYTEFPDDGHNIGGKVQRIPDLLDWLFAQKRE